MIEITYVLCEQCGDDVATRETPNGAMVCAECAQFIAGMNSDTEFFLRLIEKYGHCGQ